MKTVYIKIVKPIELNGKTNELVFAAIRVTRADILVKILEHYSARYIEGDYINDSYLRVSTRDEFLRHREAWVPQASYLH